MKKHTLNCLVFVTVNARRFTAVTNACRCGCRYSPGAARSDLQTEAFGYQSLLSFRSWSDASGYEDTPGPELRRILILTNGCYSRSFIIDVFDAHFFDGRGVYGLRGEAEPCSHANRRAFLHLQGESVVWLLSESWMSVFLLPIIIIMLCSNFKIVSYTLILGLAQFYQLK